MSEKEDHYLVFKTKVWLPSAFIENTDKEEIDKVSTTFKHIASSSFKQEIEAKIPDLLVTFLSNFIHEVPKNEVKSYIAEKSKIEVDIE